LSSKKLRIMKECNQGIFCGIPCNYHKMRRLSKRITKEISNSNLFM